MNKLFYYSALFVAITLQGCSSEVGSAEIAPDYIEPGASLMQVAINFPAPQGYAVGDEDTGAGTAAEKEIKSLAFFVKTSHTFGKYLSSEQLLSANGFTESLKETVAGTSGSYTASFKVRSAKFDGLCEVVAVANYVENGLSFAEVGNMRKLKQMVTDAMNGASNLKTPLLMYSEDATVSLVDGQATALSLEMERLVARVDVNNLAADAVTPADGFILESVRLLNAPTQSALIPEQGQTYAAVDFPAHAATADESFVKYNYLYETPNDDPANRPRVELKGTFKGTPVLKEVAFRTADAVDLPGDYFAIQRNYRYIVEILPAEEAEDLTFNMKVKEWDAGDIIEIKPSMQAPKLENFAISLEATALAAQGITWDESTATLTLTQALTAECVLSFDASAFQAPKHAISVAEGEYTFIQDSHVIKGDLSGYSETPMPLKRSFSLKLPSNFAIADDAITAGSTHTNVLKILVTEGFVTPITIMYVDQREAPEL